MDNPLVSNLYGAKKELFGSCLKNVLMQNLSSFYQTNTFK